MWKFKIDTTSGDLENGNSFQHVANVQFPMCKNPFSIHFLFPANWFPMKKCSFSAWPRKNEGNFSWMKLWKCCFFFFHEETSPKNVRPARPKDPQQDGGSGIGRGIPFLFVGAWWVTFFFFRAAAVKDFSKEQSWAFKVVLFWKIIRPETWGNDPMRDLRIRFFFPMGGSNHRVTN